MQNAKEGKKERVIIMKQKNNK